MDCLEGLFGVDVPIVQGGMQGVGRAELASAMASAGALGTVMALKQPTPDALLPVDMRCRSRADKPFSETVQGLIHGRRGGLVQARTYSQQEAM